MKSILRTPLLCLLCWVTFPVAADGLNSGYGQQPDDGTQVLVQYLQNLGSYLGYNISQDPTANSKSISQQLINLPATQLAETLVFSTFFGAIPVAIAAGTATFQFVSPNSNGADIINGAANATFNLQNFSTAANSNQQSTTVSVNALIDQPTYQPDPVSQSLLNILGTPDVSFCTDSTGSITNPCSITPTLYQNQVMSNVIGPIPNPRQFYSYNYIQPLLGQLNSNSLIAPLFFTTDNSNAPSSTGSPVAGSSQSTGLTAKNQAQQAENFIRYVSGSVAPVTLPNLTDYSNLYLQAVPPNGTKVDPVQQAKAQASLSTYFTNLRIYAAQSSVGLSNLYYIMSKRLPQNLGGGNSNTSQAMSEFNMATWRLFNPGTTSQNKQWIEGINNGSSATVQKEIAVLLAEINYQMYLDRQIQERILLTNSVMLMQNTKASQPSADFNNQTDQEQSTGQN